MHTVITRRNLFTDPSSSSVVAGALTGVALNTAITYGLFETDTVKVFENFAWEDEIAALSVGLATFLMGNIIANTSYFRIMHPNTHPQRADHENMD